MALQRIANKKTGHCPQVVLTSKFQLCGKEMESGGGNPFCSPLQHSPELPFWDICRWGAKPLLNHEAFDIQSWGDAFKFLGASISFIPKSPEGFCSCTLIMELACLGLKIQFVSLFLDACCSKGSKLLWWKVYCHKADSQGLPCVFLCSPGPWSQNLQFFVAYGYVWVWSFHCAKEKKYSLHRCACWGGGFPPIPSGHLSGSEPNLRLCIGSCTPPLPPSSTESLACPFFLAVELSCQIQHLRKRGDWSLPRCQRMLLHLLLSIIFHACSCSTGDGLLKWSQLLNSSIWRGRGSWENSSIFP